MIFSVGVRFLTAYTSEYAPVELVFRAVNAKLKKQIVRIETDFSKIKFMKIIVETIEQAKANSWMQLWESVKGKSLYDMHFYIKFENTRILLGNCILKFQDKTWIVQN